MSLLSEPLYWYSHVYTCHHPLRKVAGHGLVKVASGAELVSTADVRTEDSIAWNSFPSSSYYVLPPPVASSIFSALEGVNIYSYTH